MKENERKIEEAVQELVRRKDQNATAEVNVTVTDTSCRVEIKTQADIKIGDVIPIAGRYSSVRIRPQVIITK